jgi:hypothetical protein
MLTEATLYSGNEVFVNKSVTVWPTGYLHWGRTFESSARRHFRAIFRFFVFDQFPLTDLAIQCSFSVHFLCRVILMLEYDSKNQVAPVERTLVASPGCTSCFRTFADRL